MCSRRVHHVYHYWSTNYHYLRSLGAQYVDWGARTKRSDGRRLDAFGEFFFIHFISFLLLTHPPRLVINAGTTTTKMTTTITNDNYYHHGDYSKSPTMMTCPPHTRHVHHLPPPLYSHHHQPHQVTTGITAIQPCGPPPLTTTMNRR